MDEPLIWNGLRVVPHPFLKPEPKLQVSSTPGLVISAEVRREMDAFLLNTFGTKDAFLLNTQVGGSVYVSLDVYERLKALEFSRRYGRGVTR